MLTLDVKAVQPGKRTWTLKKEVSTGIGQLHAHGLGSIYDPTVLDEYRRHPLGSFMKEERQLPYGQILQ